MELMVWSRAEWLPRARAHRERAQAVLQPVTERRARAAKHPIEDFLFDYYRLRPSDLLEWHPGMGVALADAEEFIGRRFYREIDGVVTVDVDELRAKRAKTVAFVHDLVGAIDNRPAHFGCFGMHEWAMVHGLEPGQVRHVGLPLRFSPEQTAQILESSGVRCSHFDAFRFFTDSARGLNTLQLTRADQRERDQPGCLHVGMDLYKWVGKLHPLTSSELLFDTFELACDIRLLDMRASPYDVSSLGHRPVAVETPSGRAEYARQQRDFSDRAVPLRARLLEVTTQLVAALGAS